MKCEACGGDGLIEVGAYRGDDTTETRECRLCGGVVTLESRRSAVAGYVAEVERATSILSRLTQAASPSAAAIMNFAQATAEEVAREYEQRLREQNEREQEEAEGKLIKYRGYKF